MDKYKTKPTQVLLTQYVSKLEYFLSAHGLDIFINLRGTAPVMRHTRDGQDTGTTSFWLERIEVTTPTIKKLKLDWHGWGIEEDITDREIWHHAWSLQNMLYQKMSMAPLPVNDEDPYWNLWKYLDECEGK